MKTLLSLLLLLFLTTIYSSESAPIVTTKNGLVKGFTVQVSDGRLHKDISVFQGIPFGQPPVGALRYQKPKPTTNWKKTLDTIKPRSACSQPSRPSSEDCLYLTVWTPSQRFPTNDLRAVIVWIHGGGFIAGSAFEGIYNGSYLSGIGDVVVVGINYRLSVFGFFYDGTEQAPGNVGLYDQLLALKWVKDNIRSFGGDPNSVTVIGQSAGGMSVGSLMLVTSKGDLFRRAVVMSGSPNSFYGTRSKDQLLQFSTDFAKEFNCTTNGKININCMRKTNNKEMAKLVDKWKNDLVLFTPIYGDELMPIKPAKALVTGKFRQNVDLIFGSTTDELSTDLSTMIPSINKENLTVAHAKTLISLLFRIQKFGNDSAKVAAFYTKKLKDSDGDRIKKAVGDSFSDYQLTCPTVLFGSFYQKWNRTNRAFAYAFNYTVNRKWTGVRHGEDVWYLFGGPIRNQRQAHPNQVKVSRDLIASWASFAKTGVPGKFDGTVWNESVASGDSAMRHLSIDPDNYRVMSGFYKETCEEFWLPYLSDTSKWHGLGLNYLNSLLKPIN